MSENGSGPPRATLLVIAKEPVAGRAKTRLTPPCTPEQAARLATASLADTLDAVAAVPDVRRILVLDGTPGRWCPPGFDLEAQVDGGLDVRLEAAFAGRGGPALLIGMDTPQVTPGLLEHALAQLSGAGPSRPAAVLGLAVDGGWWAVGFARTAPAGAFAGVPMSTSATGVAQRDRLVALGLDVVDLPVLRDVDHVADLAPVAAAMGGGRFPAAVRDLATVVPGASVPRAGADG